MSTLERPPEFLDLAWRRGRDGMWIAPRTELGDIALARSPRGMAAIGMTGRDRLVEWDLALAPPEPRLSARLAHWERHVRDEAKARARAEAARRPVGEDAVAAVQAALAAALAATSWAFGMKQEIAQGFAKAATLTPGEHRFARSLLQDARCVVVAVDRRLAEPAGQEDLAAARDADTRAALLEACRFLSDLDSDRCRDRNGVGWSAVASGAGHRLAGGDSLTVLEAAHARRLVQPHRRQLPAELRDRLFG